MTDRRPRHARSPRRAAAAAVLALLAPAAARAAEPCPGGSCAEPSARAGPAGRGAGPAWLAGADLAYAPLFATAGGAEAIHVAALGLHGGYLFGDGVALRLELRLPMLFVVPGEWSARAMLGWQSDYLASAWRVSVAAGGGYAGVSGEVLGSDDSSAIRLAGPTVRVATAARWTATPPGAATAVALTVGLALDALWALQHDAADRGGLYLGPELALGLDLLF